MERKRSASVEPKTKTKMKSKVLEDSEHENEFASIRDAKIELVIYKTLSSRLTIRFTLSNNISMFLFFIFFSFE